MQLQRELNSGVLYKSIVPDMIDPEEGMDPESFYNTEFSIVHFIKFLTNNGFEVVFKPAMPHSMGNVQIYVLKRESFRPNVPKFKQ